MISEILQTVRSIQQGIPSGPPPRTISGDSVLFRAVDLLISGELHKRNWRGFYRLIEVPLRGGPSEFRLEVGDSGAGRKLGAKPGRPRGRHARV